MRTARLEIDLPSARHSPLAAAAPPPPRASWPSRRKKRRKKQGENRGGDITPMLLRQRLRRQARLDRQDPPRPTRPDRLRSARRPQAAPGSRAQGAFVLSKTAAQDARALRKDDLRPRCREGESWSQIRCRHGRSVHRWFERVAQPKTAARTAAPAKSLLPCPLLPTMDCSLLPTIARNCPELLGGVGGVTLNKCPRTVSRSRSASRRAPFAAAPVALRAASAAANAQ